MKLASPHSDRDSLLDDDALAKATDMDYAEGGRRVDGGRVIPLHLRGCQGDSCAQGRKPCRDRCGAEQAAPDDDNPNLSAWTRARMQLTRLLAGFTRRR